MLLGDWRQQKKEQQNINFRAVICALWEAKQQSTVLKNVLFQCTYCCVLLLSAKRGGCNLWCSFIQTFCMYQVCSKHHCPLLLEFFVIIFTFPGYFYFYSLDVFFNDRRGVAGSEKLFQSTERMQTYIWIYGSYYLTNKCIETRYFIFFTLAVKIQAFIKVFVPQIDNL